MKRLFFKTVTLCIISLCLLGTMSCAPDKMPEEGNQQTILPSLDTTPIDKALFSAADDNHTRMGRDYFVNMPGMVLFYDQDFYFSGGGICYVNKTSKVASIYCFDALCEYLFGVCSARFAQRTADIVYQPADGLIYCLRTSEDMLGTSDGNLYAISPDTLQYERVFEGDGNELRFLQVKDKFIYFARHRKDGEMMWYRYDVRTKRTDLLSLENKSILDLYVRYDEIYVSVLGEDYLYRTNDDLSIVTPTGVKVSEITRVRYDKCYQYDRIYDDQETVDLYEYDITTGERRLIATQCSDFQTIRTITDEHVYFINKDKTLLSRCGIEDGTCELLYDFSTIHESARFKGIKVFDGDIYIVYIVDDTRMVMEEATHWGNLVRKDGTWEIEEFVQGRVIAPFAVSFDPNLE